ncbi:unnamed protein product [Rotaria sp. Silwood2]|nr:unnamed protein product [Rotaria sp. Silwood2]CAF4362405.1 unnamed protein product [Rotaria sp. Silwood2]
MSIEAINRIEPNGSTALHVAAYRGYEEIVDLLLQNGASNTIINKYNLTPLDEAKTDRIKQLIRRRPNKTRFVSESVEWIRSTNDADFQAHEYLEKLETYGKDPKFYQLIEYIKQNYLEKDLQDIDDIDIIKKFFDMAIKKKDPVYLLKAYTAETGFYSAVNIDLARIEPENLIATENLSRAYYIGIIARHPKLEPLSFTGVTYRGMMISNEDIKQYKKGTRILTKTFSSSSKEIENFVTPAAAFAGMLSPPPMNEELEPIDYFYSMFDRKSITLLTDQSNLYSVQTNPNKPARISEVEMVHFIGVLIMTGIYCFPEQRFFWMNTSRVESISSVMSRDRFLEIKKYLHVVDNSKQLNRTDPNFDRAHKVRPLLNIVKENFREIEKEEKLSVDEQIIPFKGKSIMKQHMPSKPNRWGYKMFLLAGGESGICYDFIFYTGKSDKPEYGFCTNIVLDLRETVPQAINHKVYCDNYFTTIRLHVELKKVGTYVVGTVRPNRLTDLIMKNGKELSSKGRGAMDHRVAEVDGVALCVPRWYDNNVVNCLSTLHGCEPVNSVERWSSKQKKHIQIVRPHVVKAYNQHMGGVDLMDMLISLHRIDCRSKKYYTKIIFHLIDLCIVNGWLLYRCHCFQLNIQKKNIMSLLAFRIKIADALLKSVPATPPVKRGRPSLDSISNENNPMITTRVVPSSVPTTSVRLDKFDHWSVHKSKGRCRNPGCSGYTRISCSKCLQRLCLTDNSNCFIDYHHS